MRGQSTLQAIGMLTYVGCLVLFFAGLALAPARLSQRLETFNEARAALQGAVVAATSQDAGDDAASGAPAAAVEPAS